MPSCSGIGGRRPRPRRSGWMYWRAFRCLPWCPRWRGPASDDVFDPAVSLGSRPGRKEVSSLRFVPDSLPPASTRPSWPSRGVHLGSSLGGVRTVRSIQSVQISAPFCFAAVGRSVSRFDWIHFRPVSVRHHRNRWAGKTEIDSPSRSISSRWRRSTFRVPFGRSPRPPWRGVGSPWSYHPVDRAGERRPSGFATRTRHSLVRTSI